MSTYSPGSCSRPAWHSSVKGKRIRSLQEMQSECRPGNDRKNPQVASQKNPKATARCAKAGEELCGFGQQCGKDSSQDRATEYPFLPPPAPVGEWTTSPLLHLARWLVDKSEVAPVRHLPRGSQEGFLEAASVALDLFTPPPRRENMNAQKVTTHFAADAWYEGGQAMEFFIPLGVVVACMTLMGWLLLHLGAKTW